MVVSWGVQQASQVIQVVKNLPANAGDMRFGLDPWVRKIPWRRAWQPTPVFLPGESYGQRSLAGSSPSGPKELDMTERLSLYLKFNLKWYTVVYPAALVWSWGWC